MAYSGVTIETAVKDDDKSSHCIPAYPEYTSSTTYNNAFYTARQTSNNKMLTGTITLEEV